MSENNETNEQEVTAKEETAAQAAPQESQASPAETAAPQEAPAAAEQAETASSDKPKAAPKPTTAAPKIAKGGKDAKMYTGRRKTSISRVKLTKGEGEFVVNRKPVDKFFSKESDVSKALQPLKLLGIEKDYNILATVKGGGTTGQAEAIRMGLSRSLKEMSDEFHKKLREAGFLTRDSRMVERKKYGLHKARRASQFSKR